MAVLIDTRCRDCGREFMDAWSDERPVCCGRATDRVFTVPHTTEWGSPRTFLHIRDEPFSSRSELASYAKANGMALGESAEKVGGARNEEHLRLGKKFSYRGSPKS